MLDVEDAVWQRLLLPKLGLADLQSLSHASTQLRRLVRAAQPDTWSAAAARQDLPITRVSALTSYQSVAQMAAQYAAVKAGMSTTASAGKRVQQVSGLPLHPDFAETLERGPEPGWRRIDARNARQAVAGLGQAYLQSSMYLLDNAPDSCCATNVQHIVAYFEDHLAESEPEAARKRKWGAENPVSYCAWAEGNRLQMHELRLWDYRSGVHVRIQLGLAFRIRDISWAPDSSAFALHCEADGNACEVYRAPAHPNHATCISGWVPDIPGPTSTWSPCSRYWAAVGECALVLARPRDQTILAVIDEEHVDKHFALYRQIGMSFAVIEGRTNLVVWPEARPIRPLVSSCESQPFVIDVAEAGQRLIHTLPEDLQELALQLPLYQVTVGYALAGIRADGEVVLYQLRTGLKAPVLRTSCSVGSAGPAALAWAPDGFTWLAVAYLDIRESGATAAVLEVIDGRSGKSACRQVIAQGNVHEGDSLSITWSSSGNALVVCREAGEGSEGSSEEGTEEAGWEKIICRFWT